ncbi:hypothetical protein DFH08DRAFT_812746 [Mycena albidolilacea]|uniref:Uncharacterized protein n=1 Tax=Mycena albidolilacea TaxID=1033008 RepID=A0AAD6ZTL6_9AGAR|nr:hypothetical protein DFH08DRAFT_812746 [Mycena albidolilacea]
MTSGHESKAEERWEIQYSVAKCVPEQADLAPMNKYKKRATVAEDESDRPRTSRARHRKTFQFVWVLFKLSDSNIDANLGDQTTSCRLIGQGYWKLGHSSDVIIRGIGKVVLQPHAAFGHCAKPHRGFSVFILWETREKDENAIWRSLIQLDLAQKLHTWYNLEVGYSARMKKCSCGFAQCPKAAGSRMRLVRLLHNLSIFRVYLAPTVWECEIIVSRRAPSYRPTVDRPVPSSVMGEPPLPYRRRTAVYGTIRQPRRTVTIPTRPLFQPTAKP